MRSSVPCVETNKSASQCANARAYNKKTVVEKQQFFRGGFGLRSPIIQKNIFSKSSNLIVARVNVLCSPRVDSRVEALTVSSVLMVCI